MSVASLEDTRRYETEMPWEARDVPSTVYEMLTITKDKFPNRPAVTFQLFSGPDDKAETLTWTEFHAQVTQAANLFRSLRVGPTDVVAMIMPNCTETVIATIAASIAGIVNPINPLLEPEQIAAILRETNAKVVVTLKPFPKTDVPQKAAEAVRHAPNVQTVLEVDLNRYLTPPKSWIVPLVRPKIEGARHADLRSFNKEVKSQPTTLSFEDTKEDRVAAYFHTGGTTGMPKVAQHKNSGIVYQGWIGHELLYTEEDSVMCPLPMFHVFACHVILMAVIKSGAHVVFPTPAGYRGDGVFDNFWKLCERWRTTFVITVPTAVAMLMQRPVDADISRVRNAFSGSAPMPLELFNRFTKATGVNIIEGYGLTEATCLVSCNPLEGEKKVGSVGIRFPYTDVKIYKVADGAPVECGVDEVGEICVSNPGVWAGNTYTEADKNKDLYHNEKYLRTGDLGRLDGDGYLWITGRAKDLIIRGGHNIDPVIIEEPLSKHPAVAEVIAIGQPDAYAGEIPIAYVRLKTGIDNMTPEKLLTYCTKTISERAAVPKRIEILEAMPMTVVGKFFKPALRCKASEYALNEAFSEAGIDAQVAAEFDSERGQVVQITLADKSQEAQARDVVEQFSLVTEFS